MLGQLQELIQRACQMPRRPGLVERGIHELEDGFLELVGFHAPNMGADSRNTSVSFVRLPLRGTTESFPDSRNVKLGTREIQTHVLSL